MTFSTRTRRGNRKPSDCPARFARSDFRVMGQRHFATYFKHRRSRTERTKCRQHYVDVVAMKRRQTSEILCFDVLTVFWHVNNYESEVRRIIDNGDPSRVSSARRGHISRLVFRARRPFQNILKIPPFREHAVGVRSPFECTNRLLYTKCRNR